MNLKRNIIKNIILKSIIIALMLITTNVYAQAKSLNNFYYGGNISVNKTTNKGSWEIDSGINAGEKITYSTNGNNTTADIFLGYEKTYSDYFLAFEFGLETTLRNSTKKEQYNNWKIEFKQKNEIFLSTIIGRSLNDKNDIYLRASYMPYSKHTIQANHLTQGGWADHNFEGYGIGIGYRYKLTESLFFRSEVIYKKYDFDQPAKDNAISSEEVSETGLSFGVMHYF